MPSAVLGSPKDQFPIISKKVRWRESPTSSMSPVRTHFWILATRLPPGCFSPSKYGDKGCIPAVVKSAVGSVSLGTREEEGIIACPLLLKNSKNFFLISLERMKPPLGFEPRTYCLQNSCSTAELRWRNKFLTVILSSRPAMRGKLCWLIFIFIFGISAADLVPIRVTVAIHLHFPFPSYVISQLQKKPFHS